MTGRSVVILLAAAAVGVAAYTSQGRSLGSIGGGGGDAIRVRYAFSTNQEELLVPLIERFNDERHEVGGRRVEIVGDPISSGEAESKIAAKAYRPTLWSPASSLWGRLLNFQADAAWVPDDNPALVRTPLVIALWKPEAQALGWPRKAVGFRQILELATSRRGWADYGLPTFGRFKLGHTNPDFSTSGLSFVSAQYYTATGKREGLTAADVRRAGVRGKVRRIQQSIVHYGDTSAFFLDQLKAHGPGYVSAVAMEEVTLLEYNSTRPKGSLPLVAVYPAEGTFDFDNPVITLRAPWVTNEQARAARSFKRWLMPQITAKLAARYGYRPGDRKQRPAAPIDRAHLVDPAQPRTVLGLPEPRVLAAIKRAWHADRKAANVAVVVDTSGSMHDEQKLQEAQRGLQVFMRQFSGRDRVTLITFSSGVRTVVPLAEVRTNRAQLSAAIGTLTADGGTAVYDATEYGAELIAGLGDDTRINAVVVLTDGEDNESYLSESALLSRLRARSEDQERNVRVFTIAYGSSANKDALRTIATASGGKDYEGDPDEIEDVYRQISSYF